MLSPARRHVLKHRAAALAAATDATATVDPRTVTAYEQMLAKLAADRRRLKSIESVEQKVAVKREILPDYAPWIDGVLAAGKGAQDDVLTNVMVWRLDTGDWEGSLAIGEYVLTHGLSMPDQYARRPATILAEEMADQALVLVAAGKASEVDGDSLYCAETLVRDHDMPDQVRAKLHKAIGYVLRQSDSPHDKNDALSNLRRALELDQRVGVKKDIERLEREVRDLEPPTNGSGPPAQGGAAPTAT